MVSVFALAVVGILCGLLNIYLNTSRDSGRRRIGKAFGVGRGVGMGTAAGIMLGVVCTYSLPMHKVASKPVELVAMRSADSLNGAFIWGTGGFSVDQAYHFYKKESDGSMVPVRMWASNKVHIIEDAALQNTGTWTTVTEEVDPSSHFFAWALTPDDRTRVVREEFRVPVGTVRHTFEIK
jgi:hypothetical protein